MSRKPRSPRMRKVDELLREVLAEEIPRLKDPRIGFVTVTGVNTSPDLRHAIVYYSVLGTAEEQAATQAGLDRARRHLQSEMARQVRLKYTPMLEFRRDESIEHGLRISKLLHEIHQAEQASGAEAATGETAEPVSAPPDESGEVEPGAGADQDGVSADVRNPDAAR